MPKRRMILKLSEEHHKMLKKLKEYIDEDNKADQIRQALGQFKRARTSASDMGNLEAHSSELPPSGTAEIVISSVVSPIQKTTEGTLVKAQVLAWTTILERLKMDWANAHNIPPSLWEEIIAATFDKAGFDEVVLTPRSGDHGRDVIATMNGAGSIKLITSVKAYSPRNLVTYDDVRALLGVLSGERNASKGIITTTSGFPPKIAKDPFISPFLPTRLELVSGTELYDWILDVSKEA